MDHDEDKKEHTILSDFVSEFAARLNQTDELLMSAFSFSWKGKLLSEAESRSFLTFLRSQMASKR